MTNASEPVYHRAVNPTSLPDLPLISHGRVVPALGLVYTGGQVAWDAEGNPIGTDLATQFGRVWENLDAVLESAGTSRRHVIKETIFVVGYTPEQFPEVAGLIAASRVPDAPAPASSCIGVDALIADGFLVEIEAVAVVPPSR